MVLGLLPIGCQALTMSFQNLTFSNGDSTAVINLVGSALVGLRFGEHEVIPEIDLGSKTFAGTLLAPWPNRVEKATYQFQGMSYQLDARDGLGNALHGLVDDSAFEVIQSAAGHLKLATQVLPTESYPWHLSVEAEFELASDELVVSYRVTNLGEGNAPVGIGTHPYFPFSENTKIQINAKTAAVHGANMLPIDEIAASDLGLGPALLARVSDLKLDTQFSNLADPVATVFNEGFSYDIWQQDADWLMVYTTASFPWGSGTGNAIAIEPQTCPANAFNSGEDLRVLANHESASMRWGVRLRG